MSYTGAPRAQQEAIGGYPSVAPFQTAPPPDQKRAHLYVGNLSPRVTEHMLHEIFAVAGPVLGVKIIPDKNFQHGGLNYGFVEFHEMRAAETAIQTLNGRKIFDTEIRCNWAYQNQQAKEDLTNHCHVFVGDLSPEVTDSVLQKTFEAFGSLSDARVMWDMNSGKSRGYGFLAFRDRTDGEQAIATMNGEWLGSRAIRVNWANQKNAGSSMMNGTGGGGSVAPPPSMGAPMGAMSPMSNQPPMASMGGGMGGGYGGPPQQVQQAPPVAQAPVYVQAGGSSYEQVVNQSSSFNTTIYVGNLVPYCQQTDLIPLFQGFGYIVEVRMQADRGFAFVKLDTHENAAMAIVNLQGTPVHGRALKCSWGKDRIGGDAGPPPAQGGAAAYQPQQAAYGYQQQPQQQAYGGYAGYAQDQSAGAAQQWPTDPAMQAQYLEYYRTNYPDYYQTLIAQGYGQGL